MTHLFSRPLLSLLTISVVVASCRSTTNTVSVDGNAHGESSLLFVTLQISRDTSGSDSIVLVSNTWTTGKIKEPHVDTDASADQLLTCEFLDKHQQVSSSLKVQNPLTASLEEFSPDGSIKRVEAKSEMSYLSIRSNVSPVVVQLRISNAKGVVIGLFDLL
jgi:hypothetical protein